MWAIEEYARSRLRFSCRRASRFPTNIDATASAVRIVGTGA